MKTSFRKEERGGSINKYMTMWATQAIETINLKPQIKFLDLSKQTGNIIQSFEELQELKQNVGQQI